MDLSALSVAELNKLLSDIPKEISRREKGEKARIRKEMEVLAVAMGIPSKNCLAIRARPLSESASRRPRNIAIPKIAL